MPHIVYPDTEQRPAGNFFINPYKMNATKQWLKHYGNFKYLQFIHDNTTNGMEKRQANQEIQRCQKKLDYWFKMPNLDKQELEKGRKEQDTIWNQRT